MSEKFNAKEYMMPFMLFDTVGSDISCSGTSAIVYAAILNAYNYQMTFAEYEYFSEYQSRILNFIGEARENLNAQELAEVLEHTNSNDPALADLIIMGWAQPERIYMSKIVHQNKYRETISKYSPMIQSLITHSVVENFCIESLTKTNNIPVHSLDYVWYYMELFTVEFYYVNKSFGNFIKIEPCDKIREIKMGINLETIYALGIGKVRYPENKKRCFQETFPDLIRPVIMESLETPTAENLACQICAVADMPFVSFPKDLVKICKRWKDENYSS